MENAERPGGVSRRSGDGIAGCNTPFPNRTFPAVLALGVGAMVRVGPFVIPFSGLPGV